MQNPLNDPEPDEGEVREGMIEDVRRILKSLPDVSFHTARNYQETFADKLRVIGDAARRLADALNVPTEETD